MELRHLRYFIAVAESLHFAQAAEKLGISAPTLTVQIQRIEQALQAQLFMRSKRSVSLTPAGAALLVEARQAVDQFERAVNVGRRAGRGELGRIEIGYVGSAVFSGILQQQLQRFRQRWPDVLVRAREFPMPDLPLMLEEGQVDLGIVRLPVDLVASLHAHVLLRDTFCVALPLSHPLAATEGSIASAALRNETFIMPEQGEGTWEVGRRGRFMPHAASMPGTLLEVLAQVSLCAGIAIVPNVLTRTVALPDVVFKPLAGEAIRSEVAAVFRKRERAPAVRNLIDQILHSRPASR